jgi:hypothetical protein
MDALTRPPAEALEPFRALAVAFGMRAVATGQRTQRGHDACPPYHSLSAANPDHRLAGQSVADAPYGSRHACLFHRHHVARDDCGAGGLGNPPRYAGVLRESHPPGVPFGPNR